MKQSHLFSKTRKDISQQEHSANAQLLERAGFISKLMSGVFTYLPLGWRVLAKIENIVRESMNELGAEELLMPALQPREPWDQTGRWDEVDVLYTFQARDKDFCLGPTHEEVITPLAGQFISSYKDLPRAVYQIQTKFRNEARPKSGLLRGREFRMKDLYSFHASKEDLDTYFDLVQKMYVRIFERVGLGSLTYYTYAAGGSFSNYSHEFQTVTENGEDTIFICTSCHVAVNQEIIDTQSTCPDCGSRDLVEKKSIEVGNIFKLQTRFSEAFGLSFVDSSNSEHLVPMGCYGLGTSRLMGAIVEALHDDKGICWPSAVAPYGIHLLCLSTNEGPMSAAQKLYVELQKLGYEILFDERAIRPGQKFAEADLIGIPLRLVISDKTFAAEMIEVKKRSDTESIHVPLSQLESVIASD